jgi:hypothetical protein
MFQTLLALFISATGAHCGLKYHHWPMQQTLLTRKVVSGGLYTYNSGKTNAQNLEISIKFNVYSYKRATDVPVVVLG